MPENFLSVEAVALRLNVSRAQVYRYVNEGLLAAPSYRRGNRVLWTENDVLAAIANLRTRQQRVVPIHGDSRVRVS